MKYFVILFFLFINNSNAIVNDKKELEKNINMQATNIESTTNENNEYVFFKAHQIVADLFYVSPMFNSDFRSYKKRINMYTDIYGGPGLAFPTNDQSGLPRGFNVVGDLGISAGFELVLYNFFFSFGLGEYNVFNATQFIYGYKFQFQIGGQIDIEGLPLIKIYALYRDNQLQKSVSDISNDYYFGYYSRNIGVGTSVNVWRGIDIGFDLSFSLLHTGTYSSDNGKVNYPLLLPQFFIKFAI